MSNQTSNIPLSISDLLKSRPLFVFALQDEAAQEFIAYDPLIVGVGKVQATYHLTREIVRQRPSLIINLGSAGSSTFERGEVICCTRFLQRDMDVTALGMRKYETPFSGHEPMLTNGLRVAGLPEGTCGTGDNFEVAHLCADYDVVDMEAFPLAFIAQQEGIPFLCLKYISDGADHTAAVDWRVEVHRAASALKKTVMSLF